MNIYNFSFFKLKTNLKQNKGFEWIQMLFVDSVLDADSVSGFNSGFR